MERFRQKDCKEWEVQRKSSSTIMIVLDETKWEYDDFRICPKIERSGHFSRVIIDLSNVRHMTTAAFAQLVLLKRWSQMHGIEFNLIGMQKQPRSLCGILNLNDLLRVPHRCIAHDKTKISGMI